MDFVWNVLFLMLFLKSALVCLLLGRDVYCALIRH